MAQQAQKFFQSGASKGLFGGVGALIGLGAVTYGANAALYNGTE
jgi:hypothetical protein